MFHGIGKLLARVSAWALVAAAAVAPAQAQNQFIGQLMYDPYNFPPFGWASCDGQIMPISQNTALFSLLGTNYGGNGQSNFALPDMRGRVPLSQGQSSASHLTYFVGQSSGSETVTLTSSNLPAHSHTLTLNAGTVSASSANANSAVPTGHALANTGHNPAYSATAPDVKLGTVTLTGNTGVAGGSQPFNIRSPYLVVSCAIALQGVFPARN